MDSRADNASAQSSAIDWITDRMLQAVTDEVAVGAAPLTFLLRRYAATGRSDLSDALGRSLAAALDLCASGSQGQADAEWLALFLEASRISEDARLLASARALAASIRATWPSRGDVDAALRSVDACLA